MRSEHTGLGPYTVTTEHRGSVLGVIVTKGTTNFTVTSESTTGEIHVWDPGSNTLLVFRQREVFDAWRGESIPSA